LVWIQVSPEFRRYYFIYFASVKRGVPLYMGMQRGQMGVNIKSLIKKKTHKFFHHKRGGSPPQKVKGKGGDPSKKGGVKLKR